MNHWSDTPPAGKPPADPPREARAVLAAAARRWQDEGSPGLPAAVVDWLVLSIDHGLQGAPIPDGAGGPWEAFPAGWPADPAAAVAALDRLQFQGLAALLAAGALGHGALAVVFQAFDQARQEALQRQQGSPPDHAQALEQALAARDRQLSVATHELRTPIASILLNLQMLERAARMGRALDAETVTRMLAVPARQLRRLTRMVDLLLDAAQVENERLVLHRQELDLCQLVHDAAGRLRELARDAGSELDLQACQRVAGRWDRVRLEQVVTNLVSNAIKYGGGQVRVRTWKDHDAHIEVQDDGPGIAVEDQQRIFEPYERLPATAAEEGAGLGLYIVREIVRAHGGRISVDSQAGAGSTFHVQLPIQTQEP